RANFIQYFFTTFFFFITISIVSGQIETSHYQTESIYLKGNKYVKNGIEYPIGFWGKNLKKEMQVSQDAVVEFSNFERKHKTAFILSTITIATFISALYVDNTGLRYGVLIGGMSVSIISNHISQ